MRRIVLVLILVGVVGFAAFMLFRSRGKGTVRSRRSSTSQDSTGAGEPAARRSRSGGATATSRRAGRTTGRLRATTAKEQKAEARRLRKEERRRKRELRRQERERRRMLRSARSRTGRRRGGRKGGGMYIVKAIVSLGTDSYALVDSRRVQVGDVVMGRRIVAIMPDRLEVDAFGRQSVVRVGESLVPSLYVQSGRRR